MKNNHFGTIIIFFVLLAIIILATINVISREVDRKIEKIKLDAQEVIEGIKCEFDYKNIHYKGICTKELLDEAVGLVSYDKSIELLQFCMQNSYAYKYELCKDMEVK